MKQRQQRGTRHRPFVIETVESSIYRPLGNASRARWPEDYDPCIYVAESNLDRIVDVLNHSKRHESKLRTEDPRTELKIEEGFVVIRPDDSVFRYWGSSWEQISVADVAKQTSTLIWFHERVNAEFETWAADLKMSAHELRQKTVHALGSRIRESLVVTEGNSDLFELGIERFHVYFSTAPVLMVRGYGWSFQGRPIDHRDGGGFYLD